jgi:folate-dependent phosphoribosylglycinamide formyltransferase PurN
MVINWVPFFSQTGSEIYSLCDKLDIEPLFIVTNSRHLHKRHINDNLFNRFGHKIVYLSNKPTLEEYNNILLHCTPLITLHGWLRIIPKEICELYNIVNGHPAPIHIYPELKGKDKQEDQYIYKERYQQIGTVIHKVTSQLDEGEIILYNNNINTLESIDDAYNKLHIMSFELWCNFFKVYLLK